MSRLRPGALALLGAFAALAAACRDATAPARPGPEAGTYVSRSLDGKAMPALIDSGPIAFDVMDADTVVLDGLGGAVRATTTHTVSPTFGTSAYHFHTTAAYRFVGDSISVGFFTPCPAGALCIPNETGVLRGDTITLGHFWSFHERFVRVAPPGLD
jgi:hypothetical protein